MVRVVLLLLMVFSSLLLLFSFEIISLNIIKFNSYVDNQHNPYYHLSFGLITLIVLSFIVKLFNNHLYLYSWYIKVFVVLFIGGYFEFVNPNLDQYYYYENAVVYWNKFSIQPGTAFVIYINYLLSIIFGNSFYSLKIANTFISFIGLVLLYKSYLVINENNENDTFYSGYYIFLLPSVLIWSSLIGKDSLILFTIGLFIYSCIKFIQLKEKKYLFLLFISLILSLYIRPWIILIMLGTLTSYGLIYIRLKYKVVVLLLFLSTLFILQYILPTQVLELLESGEVFIKLGEIQQSFVRGNTAQELPIIKSIGDYVYYYLPNLFISLFMPLPFFSTNSIFMWFFSLENLLILIGTIAYIVSNIKYVLQNRYLQFLLIFIFCWSFIYVILSPGNLGTALRYKTQVWPILMMIILVSYNYKQKIKMDNNLK